MAFIPLFEEEGKVHRLEVGNTTFTKGDACVFDGSGQMVKATAGNGAPIWYVIAETVASAATAGDLHSFWPTWGDTVFLADTTANPSQGQMGTYVDLVTDAGTIDTAASTDDLFMLMKIQGAVADKKVHGIFKQTTIEAE